MRLQATTNNSALQTNIVQNLKLQVVVELRSIFGVWHIDLLPPKNDKITLTAVFWSGKLQAQRRCLFNGGH